MSTEGGVSLSWMLSVAFASVPRIAPPVGLNSETFTVSVSSTSVSSRIGIVKVFGVLTPSGHASVPTTEV